MSNAKDTNQQQYTKTTLEIRLEQISRLLVPSAKNLLIKDALMGRVQGRSPKRKVSLRIGKNHYDDMLVTQKCKGEAFLDLLPSIKSRVVLRNLRQDDATGEVILDCEEQQDPNHGVPSIEERIWP